jgi:hypothetical protein
MSESVDDRLAQSRPVSLSAAVLRGARLGLKWSIYIFCPLGAILLLCLLVPVIRLLLLPGGLAFITTREPLGKLCELVLGVFGICLVCSLWGCVLGIVISCTGFLFRR